MMRRKASSPTHTHILTPENGETETQPGGTLAWSPRHPWKHAPRGPALTGPQSETVHWRSQGGPVQSFSPTGLVLGSHSFSSWEQRMSLVTTLRSPHLAVHCEERGEGGRQHRPPRLETPPRAGACAPRTTRTSPTAARRPGSGTSCAPRAARPRPPRTGHCTRSCRSRATASSSSARCGTGSPRRRCASTRSSCWSPTCLGRGAAFSDQPSRPVQPTAAGKMGPLLLPPWAPTSQGPGQKGPGEAPRGRLLLWGPRVL